MTKSVFQIIALIAGLFSVASLFISVFAFLNNYLLGSLLFSVKGLLLGVITYFLLIYQKEELL